MSPYYNMTALAENVTGLDSMVTGATQMTSTFFGFNFGVMLLMGLWCVFFMAFLSRTGDTNRSIATSSAICFMLSVLMWLLDWIALWWMVGLCLAAAASIAFVFRYR
jgi:hypothetical protein